MKCWFTQCKVDVMMPILSSSVATPCILSKSSPISITSLRRLQRCLRLLFLTAGRRDYASQVLDKLDPEGRLFSRRFYQDSCTFFKERNYVKDLTILGVDLAKVAIIDNLPKMFLLQRDNGIPIKSWYQDQLDVELVLNF